MVLKKKELLTLFVIFFLINIPLSLAVINLDQPLPNLTKEKQLMISGTTGPESTITIYFDSEWAFPETITLPDSTQVIIITTGADGRFEGTISLLPGIHNITIRSEDKNFNRVYTHYIVNYDNIPPRLSFNLPSSTNQVKITVPATIDEDATIDIFLNDEHTGTLDVKEGSFNLTVPVTTLSLIEGDNIVVINATDLVGNSITITKNVEVDTIPPTLAINSVGEKEFNLFKDFDELNRGTQPVEGIQNVKVYYQIVTIKGVTSEPNVNIEITNLRNTTNYYFNKTSGLYEDPQLGFIIQTGFRGDVADIFFDYEDTITSDENGNFEKDILLMPQENIITFLMTDKAGNTNIQPGNNNNIRDFVSIYFDPGSQFWSPGITTTLPNWLPAGDMIQGPMPGGIIFRIVPTAIDPSRVGNIRATASLDGGKFNNNMIRLMGQPTATLDKFTGEVVGYQKISINTFSGKIEDIPKAITFVMTVNLRYNYDGRLRSEYVNIKDSFIVEDPFDTAKLLNPSRTKSIISGIDNSLEWIDRGIDITKKISFFTAGVCTALWAWEYIKIAFKMGEPNYERLYTVCDRVACPYVPPNCANLIPSGDGLEASSRDGSKVLFIWRDKARLGMSSKTNTCRCSGEREYCVEKLRERTLYAGASEITPLGWECTDIDNAEEYYINLKENSPYRDEFFGCYSSKDPNYDHTKCLPNIGKKKDNPSKYFTDVEPYDDILISTACGCFTGMYNNLEQISKILNTMKQCLSEAQEGHTSIGFCEKMLALYSCDLVFWGIKKFLPSEGGVSDRKILREKADSPLIWERIDALNKHMSKRYEGSFSSRYGFAQSQQRIVHKACQGAITQDWSGLRNELTTLIETTPKKPQYLPLIAESRVFTFNPYTGLLTVRYLITPSIFAGNQAIHYRVKLICDKNGANGEYCNRYAVYPRLIGGTIPPESTFTENIVINDDQAEHWYNKVELELNYVFKNQPVNVTLTSTIWHRGGMIKECHLVTNPLKPSIGCSSFDPTFLSSLEFKGALFSPSGKTTTSFYEGNDVNVMIGVRDVMGFDADHFLLKYELFKPDRTLTTTNTDVSIPMSSLGADGKVYVNLFNLKDVGAAIDKCSAIDHQMSKFVSGLIDEYDDILDKLDGVTEFELTINQGEGVFEDVILVYSNTERHNCGIDSPRPVTICRKGEGEKLTGIKVKVTGIQESRISRIKDSPVVITVNKIKYENNQRILDYIGEKQINTITNEADILTDCEKFRVETGVILNKVSYFKEGSSENNFCAISGNTATCNNADAALVESISVEVGGINQNIDVQCTKYKVDANEENKNKVISFRTENACIKGVSSFPPGSYSLKLSLFRDDDNNDRVDGDTLLMYNLQNQTKRLTFELRSLATGVDKPEVEITWPYPNIYCDYKKEFDVYINTWDDLNKIEEIEVYSGDPRGNTPILVFNNNPTENKKYPKAEYKDINLLGYRPIDTTDATPDSDRLKAKYKINIEKDKLTKPSLTVKVYDNYDKISSESEPNYDSASITFRQGTDSCEKPETSLRG